MDLQGRIQISTLGCLASWEQHGAEEAHRRMINVQRYPITSRKSASRSYFEPVVPEKHNCQRHEQLPGQSTVMMKAH